MRRLLSRSPFAFLLVTSRREEAVCEYVLREHGRGRALRDVLEDHYVRNRLAPEEVPRLFDRPELVAALGDEALADERRLLAAH